MRILEHHALHGSNYYTTEPAIRLVLDVEGMATLPANDALARRLVRALPGLAEWDASGATLEARIEGGLPVPEAVLRVARELQRETGHPVGAGEVRSSGRAGVHVIVHPFVEEAVALQAGRDAVDLVESLVAGRAVDVEAVLRRLRRVRDESGLGPSTGAIVAEAKRRGIPVLRLDGSFVQLGQGARQRRIQSTLTDATSVIGADIADDKVRTKRILADAGIPVPRGEAVDHVEDALDVAAALGYPVVLKPLIGNHGRGITTNVATPAELYLAWDTARTVHPRVVVERFLEGGDHRLLVIGHKFVAAARREPAHVEGDGRSTVRELIARLNDDPLRGEGHERVLTRVRADDDTIHMLEKQGLALESVPAAGRRVVLKSTANLSTGATATDVTEEVHPRVRALAENISRIVGLDIIGIDIVAPTLARPLEETGGGVVEVNAAPGLRMHLAPAHGQPRDVVSPIVDMLFPDGANGRIPLVAITGTNGKTTTGRLIAHILRGAGGRVGVSSTTGVEVDGVPVLEGDYSGPSGARTVLRDPSVDHAVLEVARGGILRRGLGFDHCDVGLLLNVGNDHLGEGEVDTIDDLARLKGVVVRSARKAAVLNAEDARVAAFRERVGAPVIFFALDPGNALVEEHVRAGGIAVTVIDGAIAIRRGGSASTLLAIRDVPVTLGGAARFNVQNALAATAACHALGVPDETIRAGLRSFDPSAGQLPGRLNLFQMDGYKVLVDYGHNVPALEALAQVLPHLAEGRIINVASAAGNRRDEDLRRYGAALATMYDKIVLCDPDQRQRAPGETSGLVRDGLRSAGFNEADLLVVPDEEKAIDTALAMARPGDLVVLQVDDVKGALASMRARQQRAPASHEVST